MVNSHMYKDVHYSDTEPSLKCELWAELGWISYIIISDPLVTVLAELTC